MQSARFEVLIHREVERIQGASMEVLATVGIKVDYPIARELFRQAGAQVNEERGCVRIPEELVWRAVEQVPAQFSLYGADAEFEMAIGWENVQFAGLVTPTAIIDMETGQHRPTTTADTVRHIQLINGCRHIHNSQSEKTERKDAEQAAMIGGRDPTGRGPA